MRLISIVHSLFLFVSLFLRGPIKSGIKTSKLSEPPALQLLASALHGKKMGVTLQESITATESFLSIKSNWQPLWRTTVDKIIHQENTTDLHTLAKQKCPCTRRSNYYILQVEGLVLFPSLIYKKFLLKKFEPQHPFTENTTKMSKTYNKGSISNLICSS